MTDWANLKKDFLLLIFRQVDMFEVSLMNFVIHYNVSSLATLLLYCLEFTKIIVIAGLAGKYGEPISNTEVLDLSGNCSTTLPNFPDATSMTNGHYIDGKIVICNSLYAKCYQLTKDATTFGILPSSMQIKRHLPRTIVTQDYIWVTGGAYRGKGKEWATGEDKDNLLATTEFINHKLLPLNKFTKAMGNITLPEKVDMHAITSFNKTFSMLIGGRTSTADFSKKTHYYNHISKTWKNGPDLITGRIFHTADIITDRVTFENHIVVLGGSYYKEKLDSEILYSGEHEWKQGI